MIVLHLTLCLTRTCFEYVHSWYVGEVIQKREVEFDNEKKKEFFIHYKDCKKMLMCSLMMCPLSCMSLEIKPTSTKKIGSSKS